MLRVTVEIVPYGDEKYKRNISVIEIANDGSGTAQQGFYMTRKLPEEEWTRDVVTNHPRKAPVEDLVRKVMEFYGRE